MTVLSYTNVHIHAHAYTHISYTDKAKYAGMSLECLRKGKG